MIAAIDWNLARLQPAFDPHADLERMFIKEYLGQNGLVFHDLCKLSDAQRKRLMIAACRYASIRLAEIELRALFIHKIHGDKP